MSSPARRISPMGFSRSAGPVRGHASPPALEAQLGMEKHVEKRGMEKDMAIQCFPSRNSM